MTAAPQSVNDQAKAAAIKAIQIRRRQVPGLEDETAWRDFLRVTAGVDSLRAMNDRQRGAVLDALAKRGAKTGPARTKLAADPQARKMRALWISLHQAEAVQSGTEQSLAAWCGRQLDRQVDDLRFVTPAEKRTLIQALIGWCQRVGVQVRS